VRWRAFAASRSEPCITTTPSPSSARRVAAPPAIGSTRTRTSTVCDASCATETWTLAWQPSPTWCPTRSFALKTRAAAAAHRQHISRWFYECPAEAHADLADLYVTDPRFAAYYEHLEPGLARYVHDAIVAEASNPITGTS
jgi:hypothetical protein